MRQRSAHPLFSLRLLEAGANIDAMADGACLDPDTAANYAAHALDEAAKREVEAHIDGCPACRELVSLVAKAAWSGAGATTEADRDVWRDVLPRGTRIGPYELRQPLSAGGMGIVYAAWDARLDRLVALKGVRVGRGDPARLLDEARLMAQLAHPNVVPVYDVEHADGQDFIAMELIVGQTLRQWQQAKPRTWKEIVDAFLQAGAGLAAAHAMGMIHGDVKPSNILVGDDGRVRVTDFGLARWASSADGPSGGTPAWFAPEQRLGGAATAATDQYAFSATLHEALFDALPGKPIVNDRPIPRGLRRVLSRGLAEQAAARFPSMDGLLQALRRERVRDRRALAVVGAGAIIAVSAFSLGGQREEQRRCEAMAGALAPVWTADARARVHDAFNRTGLTWAEETFSRVDRTLGDWQAGFEAQRQATCGGAVVAAPERERRLTCLADAARDANALLVQLLDADPALLVRAVGASQAMPSAEACAAPVETPGLAPRSDAIEAVRRQLAEARASAFAGRYRVALEQAERADEAARRVGEPHLLASARALLGGHRTLIEPNDAAARTLIEAIALAEAAGEERARAFAWSELLALEYARGRHAQVELLGPVALAAAERIHDVRLATDIQQTVGSSLSELGKPKEALPMLREAVDRRVKAFGPDDRRTSAALSTLANAQAMAGDLHGAAEAHRRALAAAKVGYGPAHPETAIIQQNLGDDFLYGLEGEAAVQELSQSVALLVAAKGPRAREVALGRTDLGFALLLVGRVDDAAAAFDEAVAVFAEVAPKHPTLALALLGRAEVAAQKKATVDLASLERAADLSADLPPFERGRVLLALGIHKNDVALVKQAREALAVVDLPLIVKRRDEADAWLKQRQK